MKVNWHGPSASLPASVFSELRPRRALPFLPCLITAWDEPRLIIFIFPASVSHSNRVQSIAYRFPNQPARPSASSPVADLGCSLQVALCLFSFLPCTPCASSRLHKYHTLEIHLHVIDGSHRYLLLWIRSVPFPPAKLLLRPATQTILPGSGQRRSISLSISPCRDRTLHHFATPWTCHYRLSAPPLASSLSFMDT